MARGGRWSAEAAAMAEGGRDLGFMTSVSEVGGLDWGEVTQMPTNLCSLCTLSSQCAEHAKLHRLMLMTAMLSITLYCAFLADGPREASHEQSVCVPCCRPGLTRCRCCT